MEAPSRMCLRGCWRSISSDAEEVEEDAVVLWCLDFCLETARWRMPFLDCLTSSSSSLPSVVPPAIISSAAFASWSCSVNPSRCNP